MTLSNYLAEVWGISIVLISLALLIKPKHLKRLFAEVENETMMFLGGIISLIIGVAMVLAHNVWVQNWQVIVTILGWGSLVKGLSVLFLPELIKNWVKKMETAPFLPFALLVMLFIGLALTYFGFTA
jgi:uncharacterized membrane protein